MNQELEISARMHESNDSPLLDRIAAGDATAVQPLLRRYRCVCDGWVQFRLDRARGCSTSMGPTWSRKPI